MRNLGVFLVALMWAGVAQAQNCTVPNTFIDGTIIDATPMNQNFSAIVNCATSAARVATNAALAASPTTSFPNGVWRDDYSAAAGAPPLWYEPSGLACTLNSGAGDGGSQVPSSDGKCWIAFFPSSGYDIRQWGAIPDWNGSTGTDNATAIQKACTFTAVNGGKLFVGPGSYKVGSQITCAFTADKIHMGISGQGRDKSFLVWPAAAGGIVVTYVGQFDSVNVSDVTFATGTTAGGIGLTLTQTVGPPTVKGPVNEIKNVAFRGADGYSATDYWTTGVQTNGMNNVNFISNTFTSQSAAGLGTGVDLEGTVSLNGAVYNFFGNQFVCELVGINYGTYIQGVAVTGGNNFTCGGTGVLVPASEISTDQLTITGNQFATLYGVRDLTGVNGTMIANNLFITNAANSFGISLEANASRSIVGNECQAGSGTSTCIQLTNGAGIINDNNIISQHQGILLGASTSNVIVASTNSFTSTTTSITDNGSGNIINGDFSWSPVIQGSSVAGSPTYGADIGVYHRDNKKISAQFFVTVNALGGISGNLQMTGLPFKNSTSLRGNCSLGIHAGFTGNPQVAAFIETSANPVIAQFLDPSTGGLASSYAATITLVGQCDYEAQ